MLDKNYFGKIEIQADGQIFDNINFDKAWKINDCLEDIVHKILLKAIHGDGQDATIYATIAYMNSFALLLAT